VRYGDIAASARENCGGLRRERLKAQRATVMVSSQSSSRRPGEAQTPSRAWSIPSRHKDNRAFKTSSDVIGLSDAGLVGAHSSQLAAANRFCRCEFGFSALAVEPSGAPSRHRGMPILAGGGTGPSARQRLVCAWIMPAGKPPTVMPPFTAPRGQRMKEPVQHGPPPR
jgi:hypothetical protein